MRNRTARCFWRYAGNVVASVRMVEIKGNVGLNMDLNQKTGKTKKVKKDLTHCFYWSE